MANTVTDSVVSVRIDHELLEKLDEVATAMDRTRSYLIVHAVRELIDREYLSLMSIQEGEAEVEAGRGVPHEQASRWMADLAAGKGRPKVLR